MQQASPRMSSWVSLQQTLNTQSSSLKVVKLAYLSSDDAALSPVAVSDIEIIW